MTYDPEEGLYTGYIYTIQNLLNNKYYVGQTTQEPYERWRNHLAYSKSKNENKRSAIANSIRTHGKENFCFEPIEVIFAFTEKDLLDTLNSQERKRIAEYNSYYDGYNCTLGGGYAPTDHSSRWIAVDAYDINGTFIGTYASMSEAGREFGIDSTCIGNCCNGHALMAGNYFFKLHGEHFDIEDIPSSYFGREVYQYTIYGDLVGHYKSVRDAERAIGARALSSNIYNYADKKNRVSGGYVWASRPEFPGFDKFDNGVNMYSLNNEYIKTYRSVKDSVSDGFYRSSVQKCCGGVVKNHRYREYYFYYCSDENQPDKTKIFTNYYVAHTLRDNISAVL